MIRHPIFVVGMPRSGTTLLSRMLDAHPGIVISPETHFFSLSPFDVEAPSATSNALAFLEQQPGVQDMNLTEAEWQRIRGEVEAMPTARPTDVFHALLQTYADRFDAEAWGEKTPDHFRHVPVMARRFPDAVFIAIVRDPRDVCLSLQSMPWSRDTLPEAAWAWRRYAQQSDVYAREMPDRFHELRYEDLLQDPRAVLESICDVLRTSFDPQMLAFHRSGHDVVSAEPWKAKARQPVDSSNTGKWRTQMGPAARWVVQMCAGPALRRKGYAAPPIPLNAAFVRDAVRVVRGIASGLARRVLRRWTTPARSDGDYTPVWIRQGDADRD